MRHKSVATYRAVSEERAKAKTDAIDEASSVETHAYLVKRIAFHLTARLPDSVQLDDLMQAGMLGLIEAASKYDASKGASFETYAGIRIRGAMLDEMRRGDWAPRSVHRNTRQIMDAIRSVEHAKGGTATDRDVAAALEVTLEEYHAMIADSANTRLFSFEEVRDGDDPSVLPRIQGGDHGAERRALLDSIAGAIDELPERQRLVMSLYYDEELNLKEIGAVLGVSESRISQILSQAVARVRHQVAEWVD